MRQKGVDKEETRRNVLDAAGRGFREHGYSGVGVDGLAKAAGVTSGAFYSHFGSKNGAFSAALGAGLDEVIEGVPRFQNEFGVDWVKEFAEYYLGKAHRDDLAYGCAMAALTAEVIRFGSEMHATYEEKMTIVAELVAHGLEGGSLDDRLARAWSMLGVLIGGVNIARAMKTEKVANDISQAIRAAAIDAAGRTRSAVPGKR